MVHSKRRVAVSLQAVLFASSMGMAWPASGEPLDCKKAGHLLGLWKDALPDAPAQAADSSGVRLRAQLEQELAPLAPGSAAACLCLVESSPPSALPVAPENRGWKPFSERALCGAGSPDLAALYSDCMKTDCRYEKSIQDDLIPACQAIFGKPLEVCRQEVLRKRPLSPARKGVGWALIVAGVPLAVLGATHMATPLFQTASGCDSLGFDHPCSADRYGLGGGLLGVGVGSALAGILTLTLPSK